MAKKLEDQRQWDWSTLLVENHNTQ